MYKCFAVFSRTSRPSWPPDHRREAFDDLEELLMKISYIVFSPLRRRAAPACSSPGLTFDLESPVGDGAALALALVSPGVEAYFDDRRPGELCSLEVAVDLGDDWSSVEWCVGATCACRKCVRVG